MMEIYSLFRCLQLVSFLYLKIKRSNSKKKEILLQIWNYEILIFSWTFWGCFASVCSIRMNQINVIKSNKDTSKFEKKKTCCFEFWKDHLLLLFLKQTSSKFLSRSFSLFWVIVSIYIQSLLIRNDFNQYKNTTFTI